MIKKSRNDNTAKAARGQTAVERAAVAAREKPRPSLVDTIRPVLKLSDLAKILDLGENAPR